MTTTKQYEIDSFKKLCNIITDENYEQITMDLCKWLAYHVHIMNEYRHKFPKESKGKTNWEIAKTSFIWIDDGKNDIKKVIIKNKETGEVYVVSN